MQKLQVMTQDLAVLPGTPAATVSIPDPACKAQRLITKMTADDVETFLSRFERTADGEDWLSHDWASLVAPLLTREAQQAYHSLPAAGDYTAFWAEISGATPPWLFIDGPTNKRRSFTPRSLTCCRSLIGGCSQTSSPPMRWCRGWSLITCCAGCQPKNSTQWG